MKLTALLAALQIMTSTSHYKEVGLVAGQEVNISRITLLLNTAANFQFFLLDQIIPILKVQCYPHFQIFYSFIYT